MARVRAADLSVVVVVAAAAMVVGEEKGKEARAVISGEVGWAVELWAVSATEEEVQVEVVVRKDEGLVAAEAAALEEVTAAIPRAT